MDVATSLVSGLTPAQKKARAAVAVADAVPTTEPGFGTQGYHFVNVTLKETAGGTAKATIYLKDPTSDTWALDDDVGVVNIGALGVEIPVVDVRGFGSIFVRVYDHAGAASVDVWLSGWKLSADTGG